MASNMTLYRAMQSLLTVALFLVTLAGSIGMILAGDWWGLPLIALVWLMTAFDPHIGVLRHRYDVEELGADGGDI